MTFAFCRLKKKKELIFFFQFLNAITHKNVCAIGGSDTKIHSIPLQVRVCWIKALTID